MAQPIPLSIQMRREAQAEEGDDDSAKNSDWRDFFDQWPDGNLQQLQLRYLF